MSFQGIERRRHQMFVTRNTEYHVRDGICVAVRDRRTGRFIPGHIAVSMPLAGGVRLYPNGTSIWRLDAPGVGDALRFRPSVDEAQQLVTSRIESIERPPKDVVASYG